MNLLQSQWFCTDQTFTDIAERSVDEAHFEGAQWRSDRLRGQRCVVDANGHPFELSVNALQDPGIRIPGAELVDAVKDIVRPAVPEVAVIEYSVDHCRGISTFHTTRIGAVHLE